MTNKTSSQTKDADHKANQLNGNEGTSGKNAAYTADQINRNEQLKQNNK